MGRRAGHFTGGAGGFADSAGGFAVRRVRPMPTVRVWRLCLVLAVLASGLPGEALAQRAEPLTVARVRTLAKEAEAEAKGDRNEIVLALDRKFRQRWGEFESFPISIVRREDLTLFLSPPYMTYRRAAAEYFPIADIPANVPRAPPAASTAGPRQTGSPTTT